MPTAAADSPPSRDLPRAAIIVAVVTFGLSGVAGLGYQIAWTRLFAVGLGHEMPGLLAVVTAFFFGLALGAIALDRVIARSPRPGHWYAGLELVIGVWAIVIVLLAPWLNATAAATIGAEPSALRQWLVAFGIPLAVLLPATAAMGATLPAMERLTARLTGRTTTVSGLYAANTGGAMLGILATAFVVIPMFGLAATVFALAAVNVGCAIAAGVVSARAAAQRPDPSAEGHGHADEPAPGDAASGAPAAKASTTKRRAKSTKRESSPSTSSAPRAVADATTGRLIATAALTGLLGIGFEVAGVRVIAQVLENTVYTYASTVAIFLGGTALGAAAWQRFGVKDRFTVPATWLLQAIALGVVFGMAVMPGAKSVATAVGNAAAGLLGPAAAGLAGEIVVSALVFGPATMAMGAMFSHLVQCGRRQRGGVGLLAGVNTLGACFAPPLVGVVAIPTIGSGWTLTVLAAGYLVLLPPRGLSRVRLIPAGAVLAILVLLPTDLRLVSPRAGGTFVPGYVREGVMGTVSVTEMPGGGRLLKVNDGFTMGGTQQSFVDRRQAHIPLLLHPAPERALFLGIGAGLTAGAATTHGDLEVTAVELVPEVVDVLEAFEPTSRAQDIDRIVVADARRFMRSTDGAWDVIVADLFHPARDGAGGLYTREHYAAIRARLAPGGLVCQWLPMHQLSRESAATIVRTFRDVFPNATGWIGHFNPQSLAFGLVATIGDDGPAGADPPAIDSTEAATQLLARVNARNVDGQLQRDLTETALTRPLDLAGSSILTAEQLARYGGDGPLNRDDLPIVTFTAPWYTYATDESAVARTDELLAAAESAARPDGTVDIDRLTGADQVTRFLVARDAFLRFGQADIRGDVAGADRALLESVRASRDFTVSASVARARWQARMQTDAPAATALLQELQAILRTP